MPILIVISILAWIWLYFLPTFLSMWKVRFWQVFWLNLLLWWSVVWWVFALVMAIDKSNVDEDQPDKITMIQHEGERYQVSKSDFLKLKKMKQMKDEGLLTDQEYEARKENIIKSYIEPQEIVKVDPDKEELAILQEQLKTGEITRKEYDKRRAVLLDKMLGED